MPTQPMIGILLAGGFGTRLKSVVKDLPKPMAPIGEVPFLEILFRQCKQQGFDVLILATGYKSEVIEQFFGSKFLGMELVYSIEKSPLGTGGAIQKACNLVNKKYPEVKNVVVLNADSYSDFNRSLTWEFHVQSEASISILLKQMHNFDRYGTVSFKEPLLKYEGLCGGEIEAFEEKSYQKKGWINSGVYILQVTPYLKFTTNHDIPFSFEQDVLTSKSNSVKKWGIQTQGLFIDIGVPEDFKRAQILLNNK